jgi:NAD(P)-dependent dehydrogenase (short-subunit alcohol dehydrogenase family)
MDADDVLARFRLDGRTALITGIGPGIGAHVARAFGAVGANVVACARTAERVDALVDEIVLAGGSATGVAADIGLEEGVAKVVESAVASYGGVDILFHNAAAGAGSSPGAHSLDLDEGTWEQAVAVNLMAPFRLAQALAPGMRAAHGGSIINVLTTAAFTPVTTLPLAAYGSTKAGLAMLTRYLAKECGPEIRVNAICPGTVASDAQSAESRSANPEWAPLMSGIPLARVGLADEVVGAALFLASAASSYVTGQVIFVDGGRVSAAA